MLAVPVRPAFAQLAFGGRSDSVPAFVHASFAEAARAAVVSFPVVADPAAELGLEGYFVVVVGLVQAVDLVVAEHLGFVRLG